jgi:competence protein ComEA
VPFSRRRDLEAARTRARLEAVCPGAEPGEPPGQAPAAGEWLLDPGSSRTAFLDAEGAERPAIGGPFERPRSALAALPARLLADPGRRGVAALALVAVLACAIAGWSAWRARPRVDTVEAVQVSAGSGPPSAAAQVVVAVAGAVRRPGLVRLPTGARVADAVEAAGGVRPGTDLGSLNLARKLADGELVTVGAAAPAAGAPTGTAGASGSLVDLNTATVGELESLPGVGPVLAQRIVDHRTQHGPFATVDQLREVDGIGASRFADLRDRVTV